MICRRACQSSDKLTKTPRRGQEEPLEAEPDIAQVSALPADRTPSFGGRRTGSKINGSTHHIHFPGPFMPRGLPPFLPDALPLFLFRPFPLLRKGSRTGADASKR